MDENEDYRDISEALTYIIAALKQQEQFCRRSWDRSRACPGRDVLAAVAEDIAACRARLEGRLKAVEKEAGAKTAPAETPDAP